MNRRICEERTHLFSPNINIAMLLELAGNLPASVLQEAVSAAQKNNEILNTVIRLEDNGEAFYSEATLPHPVLAERRQAWQAVVQEQARQPFRLAEGELVRYFCLPGASSTQLLIIAHHLAGDGLSIAILAEDILLALAGKKLTLRPFLPSPKGADALSPMLRSMVKGLNRSWEKQGRVFSWEDYQELFQHYWAGRQVEILRECLSREVTQALQRRAKQEGVTLNSVLTTAFFKACGTHCDLGLAVSIRQTEDKGMGNHASGISVKYRYEDKINFWNNARAVHRHIYHKLDDPKKRLFLLRFMSSLSPTLVDSAYFSAFCGYQNRVAKTVQRMFGYSGNPKGLSVTNLGNLSALREAGMLLDFAFIPPLVPNAKRLLGISGMNGSLQITFCAEPGQDAFFRNAMDCLRSSADA